MPRAILYFTGEAIEDDDDEVSEVKTGFSPHTVGHKNRLKSRKKGNRPTKTMLSVSKNTQEFRRFSMLWSEKVETITRKETLF